MAAVIEGGGNGGLDLGPGGVALEVVLKVRRSAGVREGRGVVGGVHDERCLARPLEDLCQILRNLGWARKAIFSFSYAPLDLITVLAIATVFLSLVGAVVAIVIRIARPDVPPTGFTTVIVLVLFLGGIQLLCLSIIGSYLAHIYDEVKRRPPFIVESVINPPKARDGDG